MRGVERDGDITMTGPKGKLVTLSNLLFFAENAHAAVDTCHAAQQRTIADMSELTSLREHKAFYEAEQRAARQGRNLVPEIFEAACGKVIKSMTKAAAGGSKRLREIMEKECETQSEMRNSAKKLNPCC